MGKKQYIIQFGGLPVGSHLFEMDLNQAFFKEFEHSEFSSGQVKAEMELTRQNNLLTIAFRLEGEVVLPCDRCAKEVPLPISVDESMVVKYGKPEESTDEIIVLPQGETELDVSHLLYEFIYLALPARRVPCEENKNIKCDQAAIKALNAIQIKKEKKDSIETNPIWEKLKDLKNKN
jgi:uncharacterized protein